MAESFCRFFELKSFLFEFYFFELYLFESSIGSMMINTISLVAGAVGCISARHGSPRACGPRAAVACRDLAILPRLPGEIVYISARRSKRETGVSQPDARSVRLVYLSPTLEA